MLSMHVGVKYADMLMSSMFAVADVKYVDVKSADVKYADVKYDMYHDVKYVG